MGEVWDPTQKKNPKNIKGLESEKETESSPTFNWPIEGSNPKLGVISTRLYPADPVSLDLFMAQGQMSRGTPQTWGSGDNKDFPAAASWSSALRGLPRGLNPTSLPLTLIALNEEGDALRRRMLFFLPAEQEKPNSFLLLCPEPPFPLGYLY